MKKSTNNTFKLFLVLFFTLFAQNIYSLSTVKFDRQSLENQIKMKIDNALAVLINKDQYILDVKIDTRVVKPKVAQPKQERNVASNSEGFDLTDDKIAKKDYLLFHKLGIEVPIDKIAKDMNPKQKTVITKLEEAPYEKLRSVKITVLLDELLEKDVVDNIQTILKKLSFNAEVTPTMTFATAKFKEKVVVIPPQEKTLKDYTVPELLELGAKYSTSLGFLIATLFMSLVVMFLFSRYSKLSRSQTEAVIESNKEVAVMAQSSSEQGGGAQEVEVAESKSEGGSGAGAGSPADFQGMPSTAGADSSSSVQRFERYFNESKSEAATLLKKWISLKSPEAKSALIFLSQELEPEMLLQTFEQLSLQERKTWRGFISSSSDEYDQTKGARFVDEQILEEIIVPTDLISEETKSLLYSLDVESCVRIINESPELGPLLMNTLSSSFIVKIIPQLDSEVVESLTTGSMKISPEEMKKNDTLLQSKIKENQVSEEESPFSDKIMEILPHMDIANEEYFFKAFGMNGNRAKMKELLKTLLPAKAIFNLPDSVLKVVLSKMKQATLVEFLAVSDDEIKTKMLEIIAPNGSKKREIFDLELSNVETDELQLARLKKNKDKIDSVFISFARKLIKSSAQLQEEVEGTIEELCEQYLQKDGQLEQAA